MGCDIHATMEYDKRYEGNDEWWCSFAKDIQIDRNYTLFSVLANVRNYSEEGIKPISEPRGVPENVSFEFKDELEEWGSDAHSASWVTHAELNDYTDKYPDVINLEKEDWFIAMKNLATKYGDKNVRLVFFFDN